jgi:hypothetical protein
MADDYETEEELSPAERRLLELLSLVRTSRPAEDPMFVSRLVRRANRQRTLRTVLELIGLLARAAPEAVALIRYRARPDQGRTNE